MPDTVDLTTQTGMRVEIDSFEKLTSDESRLSAFVRNLNSVPVQHVVAREPVSAAGIADVAHTLGYPKGVPGRGRNGTVPGYDMIGDNGAKGDPAAIPRQKPAFIELLHYDHTSIDQNGGTLENPQVAGFAIIHMRNVPPIEPMLWVDMRAVYRDLPANLKQTLSGRFALHGKLPATNQTLEDAPPFDRETSQRRPLVVRHWKTGEPVLHLPRHPESLIEGISASESRDLLNELWQWVEHSPHRYEAVQENNHITVWDNLAVTHTNPGYPPDKDRSVWFLTIPASGPLELFSE